MQIDSLKVFVVNLNSYIDINGGTTLADLLDSIRDRIPFSPLCAKVNNKTEDLSFPLFAPKTVEFIEPSSPVSLSLYIRSLCMMLYKAVTILFPGCSLSIDHSMSGGYIFRILPKEKDAFPPVPDSDSANAILSQLRKIADADLPFIRMERLTDDVIEIMRRQGLDDKVLLLETSGSLYSVYYILDGLADIYQGPLAPSAGYIDRFNIIPYKDGFLLMGINPDGSLAQPHPQEKMYKAFTDYLRFNKVVKISNVGELNRAVCHRRVADLINVAEALHEKQIAAIADRIADRRRCGEARFVLVAGPSSSGKTTTAKRLCIQLMANLITPKMISLDDYFVDRENTPRDESGDYDFESLYALDLKRFNSDLNLLMRGETVNLPTFSFELGRRIEKERPLSLHADDVLVIEGIHGLNPELTAEIPREQIFKVYVSALTTLHIDDHNWISTTDNRLLRRIVRDFKYRGTPAIESIRRWPSVNRGERKWIFPFQENADAMFNSSLLFEIGVMKDFALPLLENVPHSRPEYSEAYRLLKLLRNFKSVPAEQIPPTSLLREFLGGSSFHY